MSLSFYHAMLTFLSVFYDGNLEQKNHISNDKIKGRKIQLAGSKSYSFMQILSILFLKYCSQEK